MPFPNLTQGVGRELVARADVQRLRSAGVLIEDPRRERPRWFDGRFLAARDLIREQQYTLTREADLGRAAGSGVAQGLRVTESSDSQSLHIETGHGITSAGELVLLPRNLDIALANIAQAEQLSARFGLGRIPNPPMRSRTGLFVLALRPVEYTANPIGAYPSSLTGQRTVEDGDTIEATAVVLVPWPDDGATDALDARRGRVARNVFVAGGGASLSANVLPLALVALRNNTVEWVDEAMVRRELGADRGDLPGLGFSPRALRLAHLMQYQEHLADVVVNTRGRTFPASSWFPALPGAGPLPAGLIDIRDFTQGFFPAEIDVDFSPVPDDELPALIEDALLLQPIDLQASADALDSTAVLILAPVPRNEWRAVTARLASTTRVVKPAAPNLISQRKPFEVLQKLRLPGAPVVVLDPTSPSDAEWQRLARLPNLWFVRRRHIAVRDDYTGAWQAVSGVDERTLDTALRTRLSMLGLSDSFNMLVSRSSPAAVGTLTSLLSSKRLAESPALSAATIGALTQAARDADAAAPSSEAGTRPSLDLATVLKVSADLTAPGAGQGLERVEKAAPEGQLRPDTLRRIATGVAWKKLDQNAALAPTQVVAELSRVFDAPVGAPGTPAPVPPPEPAPAPPAAPTPPAPPAPVPPPTRPPILDPVTPVPPVLPLTPLTPVSPVINPATPVSPIIRGGGVVSPVVRATRGKAADAPNPDPGDSPSRSGRKAKRKGG